MSEINVTDEMLKAYRKAKDEAGEWCGCYNGDRKHRHYIVNGHEEILWEKISEDYASGHAAMKSELRRLRDVHALSAALAHPGQAREIAIKPLAWRGDFAHTEFGLFYHITERGADLCCVLEKHTDSSETKSFWLSVEEAKATAQADYDQRIRAALALPLPVQEPVASDDEPSETEKLRSALTAAVETIQDYLAYEHDGDPWKEDSRAMGEMDINDYGRDGRLEYALGLLAQNPSPSIPEEKGGTAESDRLKGIAAFERAYPDIFYRIAKGRLSPNEPMYGAIIEMADGEPIGEGESNVSLEAAFEAALADSELPTPASYPTVSKEGVILALHTLMSANGHDLDLWTDGILPSDELTEAYRAALASSTEGQTVKEGSTDE